MIQAFSAYVTNIFETVKHPVINILMAPLLANFQIAVKIRRQPSVQRFSVFRYHD